MFGRHSLVSVCNDDESQTVRSHRVHILLNICDINLTHLQSDFFLSKVSLLLGFASKFQIDSQGIREKTDQRFIYIHQYRTSSLTEDKLHCFNDLDVVAPT